jgi:hypothetical protein
MLKSLSTQFAATLFFGPLGLAYSSVAAAVFLTLLLAVLFFSALGGLALVIVWPLSIAIGLVFVKLHNDQLRSSGSRLLLGPDDDFEDTSPLNSWGRGVAVLALLLAGAFVLFLYLPKERQPIGRIVATDSAGTSSESQAAPDPQEAMASAIKALKEAYAGTSTDVAEATSPDGLAVNEQQSTPAVIAAKANEDESNDDFAVIALPEQEVATVIIDNDGNVQQGELDSALNSGRPELTVDAPLVNLRRGPGTSFDIITTVRAGDRLFEFARDGNWVNVETASSGYTGWIYSRLVK